MPSELVVGSTCSDRAYPGRTPELDKSGQMNTPIPDYVELGIM